MKAMLDTDGETVLQLLKNQGHQEVVGMLTQGRALSPRLANECHEGHQGVVYCCAEHDTGQQQKGGRQKQTKGEQQQRWRGWQRQVEGKRRVQF